MVDVRIKRIYEASEPTDGRRVLVDRVWPRGVSKMEAKLDVWLREIAPSASLCKWFNHDPHKWEEFKEKYQCEFLQDDQRAVHLQTLRDWAASGTVTLLYGAKDEKHNQAAMLRELLLSDEMPRKT